MDNAARAYEYEEELTAIRPEGDFIPASKSVENVVLKEIKLKQERKKVKNRKKLKMKRPLKIINRKEKMMMKESPII